MYIYIYQRTWCNAASGPTARTKRSSSSSIYLCIYMYVCIDLCIYIYKYIHIHPRWTQCCVQLTQAREQKRSAGRQLGGGDDDFDYQA